MNWTLLLAVTSELPFIQRKEREDPEEMEQVATAELLNSISSVWLALRVTFEMGSVEDKWIRQGSRCFNTLYTVRLCSRQAMVVQQPNKKWMLMFHRPTLCGPFTPVQYNTVQYNNPATISIFTKLIMFSFSWHCLKCVHFLIYVLVRSQLYWTQMYWEVFLIYFCPTWGGQTIFLLAKMYNFLVCKTLW